MKVWQNIFFSVALIHLSFLFSGCVSPDPQAAAEEIARRAGLIRENLSSPPFLIASWQRIIPPVTALHVYIEGDGFAWKSRTRPADNPTPRHPVGLTLAAADAGASVLYLARPCQFILPLPGNCRSELWTDDRFSPAMIEVMNGALDEVVRRYPGVKLDLTGYSGGGNIAALLAARRHDVRSLRTVAGNLDVAYVNSLHRVSAMPHALSAIEHASALRSLPQIHFSGDADDTVPPQVARRFKQTVGGSCVRTEVVSGMAHGSDWADKWAEMLGEAMPAC